MDASVKTEGRAAPWNKGKLLSREGRDPSTDYSGASEARAVLPTDHKSPRRAVTARAHEARGSAISASRLTMIASRPRPRRSAPLATAGFDGRLPAQKQSPATVLQPRFNPADKQHIAVDVRDRMQEGPPHHSGWGGPFTL
jgi:hypothetical protein